MWTCCRQTMATLIITNNNRFNVVIWLRDLNAPIPNFVLDGVKLSQGDTLNVLLQEDGHGKVKYHWAAEQIVAKNAYHWAEVFGPDVVAPLDIPSTTKGAPLTRMFRPYP